MLNAYKAFNSHPSALANPFIHFHQTSGPYQVKQRQQKKNKKAELTLMGSATALFNRASHQCQSLSTT